MSDFTSYADGFATARDDFENGWDKNARLEIDYIRAIDPPKSKPAKPPRNGKNNSSKKSLSIFDLPTIILFNLEKKEVLDFSKPLSKDSFLEAEKIFLKKPIFK